MIKQISIFYYLLIFLLFSSCKKETVEPKFDYNQKANELIQQVLLDESCGCILEIPKESMIKTSMTDNPIIDVRKQLLEKLNLSNREELDSLEKLTVNFILDSTFLTKNKIRIIPRDSVRELAKNPEFCQNGILTIRKPIFNKEYKNAIVDYGYAFMCLSSPWKIYRFENGKWKK